MPILIEACCGSVEEAVAAQRAGADRIELCAALPTGGVTPSVGMLREARAELTIPIVAMVRPREGGPCPPDSDFRAAVRDVAVCFENGADEVICGVLDKADQISSANREFLSAAAGLPLAFHRVFDMCADLSSSLDRLVDLGFVRVLTSGGEPTVDTALGVIGQLVQKAAGRITILPGGGVRAHNVAQLINAGCQELHFSFRSESTARGYGGIPDFLPVPERITEIRAIANR